MHVRSATFEVIPRAAGVVLAWLNAGFPVVVVHDDDDPVAWASAPPYRPDREAYARVAECSVYVARRRRREGLGRVALEGAGRGVRGGRVLEARQPAALRLGRVSRGRGLPSSREARRWVEGLRDVEKLLGEASLG